MKTYNLIGVVRGHDLKTENFATRAAAEAAMQADIEEYNLQLDEVLDEHTHEVTYRCEQPRTWFHIVRVMQ